MTAAVLTEKGGGLGEGEGGEEERGSDSTNYRLRSSFVLTAEAPLKRRRFRDACGSKSLV